MSEVSFHCMSRTIFKPALTLTSSHVGPYALLNGSSLYWPPCARLNAGIFYTTALGRKLFTELVSNTITANALFRLQSTEGSTILLEHEVVAHRSSTKFS